MRIDNPCGIVNVYKEKGWTSFDVVAVMRRIFGLRRVGHCGTLDPFAEGVLPICLGRATSIVRYTEQYDKRYAVTIAFGQATDTQDLTGATIGGRTPSAEELDALAENDWRKLRDLVATLPGEHEQVPPMYSAVKVKGQPLYKYARRGETVERPARKIKIDHADIMAIHVTDGPTPLLVELDIGCSKGTYIRTIASDLGERLGFGAHAVRLVRTACGPYELKDSRTPDEVKQVLNDIKDARSLETGEGSAADHLILPIDSALDSYPVIELDANYSIKLLQGQTVKVPNDHFSDLTDVRLRANGPLGFLGVVVLKRQESGDSVILAERMMADIDDYTTRF
jgi:tRNA pseudouridine55 synthase